MKAGGTGGVINQCFSRQPEVAIVRLGGAEGSRTPDLSSAIAALYQLSYGPVAISSLLLFRSFPEGAGDADILDRNITMRS